MKKLLLSIVAVCSFYVSNAQWIAQDANVGFGTFYQSIFVVDSSVALGGLNGGSFYFKTIDGGANWTQGQVTTNADYEFSNIFALDANNLWACLFDATNGGGAVFNSTNGGTTWLQSTSTEFSDPASFPNVVYFFDSNNGMILGDERNGRLDAYTTSDGGVSWTKVLDANMPLANTSEVGVVDYYEVVGNKVWYPTRDGRVFISSDMGVSWSVYDITGTPTGTNAPEIIMKTASTGMSLVDGEVYLTINGGLSWTNVASPGADYLYGDLVDDNYVIVGSGAMYSNDGVNWELLDNQNHHAMSSDRGTNAWTGNDYDGVDFFGIDRYDPNYINDVIELTIPNPPTCGDHEFTVEVTNNGGFNLDNEFLVQVGFNSNFQGSPAFVGTAAAVGSTTINCKMHTFDFDQFGLSGTYYVRVVSTSPAKLSEVVTVNITGSIPEESFFLDGPGLSCVGDSGTFGGAFLTNDLATSYQWHKPDGIQITDANTAMLGFDQSATSGWVTMQGANSCGTGRVLMDSISFNGSGFGKQAISGFKWGGNIHEPFTADAIRATDTSGSYEGCVQFAPGTFDGKIAMVDRGSCNFSQKAYFAQQAGAIGVIIRVPSTYPEMFDLNFAMYGVNYSSLVEVPVVIFNDTASGIIPSDAVVNAMDLAGSLNVTLYPVAYELELHPEVAVNAGIDQSICGAGNVQLGATGADTYSWSPATGLSATNIPNPTASPSSDQSYVVTGTSTATNCTATDTVTVFVPSASTPTANFTMMVDSATRTVTFTNTSVGSDSYIWEFGDGQTSIDENPVHVYGAYSTYTVKLTAKSQCAASDGTTQQTLPLEIDCMLMADAGPDQTVCTGGFAQLDATDAGADTYSWAPATGLSATNIPNPIASPTSTMSYVVTISNSFTGCSSKDTITVYVNSGVTPTASYTYTIDTMTRTVTFTNTTQNASTYMWYFGDGDSSNAVDPVHTYGMYGNFDVRLVAMTNCAPADGEVTQNIKVVLECKTTVNAGADETICAGGNVQLNPSVSNADSYLWTPSNGLSAVNIRNPIATPLATQEYVITVTQTWSGCTDSDTISVIINNASAPIAAFIATEDADNLTVTLTNNSVDADTYVWSFGDGNTSVEESPTHTYAAPGLYTVKLTAKSNCTASVGEFEKDVDFRPQSIVEDLNELFEIYPNPAREVLAIQLVNNISPNVSVSINDLTGKSIKEINYSSFVNGKYTLDLSEYSEGIYFVKLTTESGSAVKKVVRLK